MAHFALVNEGVVFQVIVVNNDAIGGGEYPDSEPLGQALLAECGFDGQYLQCSYNGSFRGAFPGINWRYDAINDVFLPPLEATE